MSLVLDVYCKSKAHLSERFRDAVCKKWDQEHPDLAPQRDEASDTPKQRSPPPPPPPPAAVREPAREPARPPPPPQRAPPAAPASTVSAAAAAAAAASNASTNPFLAADSNASSMPLPSDLPAADPFPTTSADAQTQGASVSGSGGSQTVLIVSSVVAALFAAMLVGAFIMYRMKKGKKQSFGDADGKRGTMMLENGIFDAVPRANPKAEFTIEDFAAAPNGLYEEEDDEKRRVEQSVPQITASQYGGDTGLPPTPLTPWGSKSGTDAGNNLIFSSPYETADTEYHISEDHVFGAPMYVVPRVGVAGINLTTPNAAAVSQAAAAAASAAPPANPRHSMEWPAEFDDDPLNPQFGFEIPYGANLAAPEDVEEFPAVPSFPEPPSFPGK